MQLRRPQPMPAPPPPRPPAPAPAPAEPQAGREPAPGVLMTPAAAAARLSVTAKVLERWRGTGGGPRYVRLTSKTIRYRAEDLDAFVAGRVQASTAAA